MIRSPDREEPVPGPTAPSAAAGSAAEAAGRLADAAGDALVAVVHFGSTLTGSSPGKASAHDLFAVVADARAYYSRTRALCPTPRSAGFLARLNRWLPPDIVRLPPDGSGPGAKVFVIGEPDFERALSRRARDQFVRGRLMQKVALVHARDPDARGRVEGWLERNRRLVPDWVRPWLPGRFDVEHFARRMMEVSYAGEIRPESTERVGEVFESERGWLLDTYGRVLRDASIEGRVRTAEGGFVYHPEPTARERLRSRLWFARSKVRATLRWTKYVLTFDGWLDYLAAKVERRTGVAVELTARRRRWPLVFLWPEFVRVLRARNRGGGAEGGHGAAEEASRPDAGEPKESSR
jgi:hypothetical protein